MADILGHEWMRGEALTQQQFSAMCTDFMAEAKKDCELANEELGIDHAVQRPRRADFVFNVEPYLTLDFNRAVKQGDKYK